MSAEDSNNQFPADPSCGAEELHDAAAPPRWLVEDRASPAHIALLRGMTGGQRLKIAEQMFWTARKLKAAGVRQQHPDWSEAKVTAEVNRIFLQGGERLREWVVRQGVEAEWKKVNS